MSRENPWACMWVTKTRFSFTSPRFSKAMVDDCDCDGNGDDVMMMMMMSSILGPPPCLWTAQCDEEDE